LKFHWFAQFYDTKLPEDYTKQVRSGWVSPPGDIVDPAQVGDDYHMYLRLMQQADTLAFDGLLLNEHHQTSLAMDPSPNLLAAVLAETTENAAIVLCGNSLALYNPPVRIAEEMAMLDVLSGGRLVSGIVFGTPMDTAFCYGMPPVEIRERFHEARKLILKSWETSEPFAFNGKYTQLRYVNIWPRPIQKNPPIWVPGSGSVETWETVVDEDYCYGYLSFSGKDSAKPIVDGFWEYCDSRGGSMSPNRMAFTQVICCADTDEEAEKQYEEAIQYFYKQNPVPLEFAMPPGYNTPDSLRAMMSRKSTVPPEKKAAAARGELSFWEYDELGYIIGGTPERVEQRLRELVTELRIGQLIPCMHVGNLSEEIAAKNNYLFGTKVMPKLRDIWADEEDRWTPAVSQQRVAKLSDEIAAQHGGVKISA
jgi:alkanesulfonate monooxygenase SsuD/methylene tetrahydromethanopterin reductase-like flavin-dependent oxidoreductase (luciferase family)